jgi:hypothetical protein
MFSASQDLVENLTIPKLRNGCGEFSIQFKLFSWNPESGCVEGFLEFSESVWTNVLKDRLAALGAGSIDVMIFQKNDGNHSAASALNRVRSVAKSEGFVEVVRGECNVKLLKKADELAEAEVSAAEMECEFAEKTQAALQLSIKEQGERIDEQGERIAEQDERIERIEEQGERIAEQAERIERIEEQGERIAEQDERFERTTTQIQTGVCHLTGMAEKMNDTVDTQVLSQKFFLNKLNKERDQLVVDLFKLHNDHRVSIQQKDAVIQQKDEELKETTTENKSLRAQLNMYLHKHKTRLIAELLQQARSTPDSGDKLAEAEVPAAEMECEFEHIEHTLKERDQLAVDLSKLHDDHRVSIQQKDAIIEKKDAIIQQKDADLRVLNNKLAAFHVREHALLLNHVVEFMQETRSTQKRKEPEPDSDF